MIEQSSSNNHDLIEIKDVTKDYQLGTVVVPALRGVDLLVKKNEYVAIPFHSEFESLFRD